MLNLLLGYQDGFKPDEFFVRDAMSGNKLSIYKYVHELPKDLTPYTDPATHMKIYKLNIDFIHVSILFHHNIIIETMSTF